MVHEKGSPEQEFEPTTSKSFDLTHRPLMCVYATNRKNKFGYAALIQKD